jgi:O-succinylbenzoic acid--CoA ligase
MICPLKQAASDAPNQIAILSQKESSTFSELSQYADRLPPPPIPFFPSSNIHTIASFFSAFRKNSPLFPVNPRLPNPHIPSNLPPHLLLYTSGSTGMPKIAILTQQNLIANALATVDLKPGDQWKLSLPLYHVGGIGILFRCILARATIVLDDSPDITHLSYVPTHLYRACPVYKKLRCLLLGGAPISSVPTNLPIFTTYGLTEMASMVTLNNQILPGREVRLSSENEILVKGPMLFQGYLGENPPSEWFATGDLGKWDNGLVITGRKDWMFISGGENIQPEEIEQTLLTIPEIYEAAVVGKEDPEFGKRPVAFVVTTLSEKMIRKKLESLLPKYKIPVAFHFMNELPKKNFKICRSELKNWEYAKEAPKI